MNKPTHQEILDCIFKDGILRIEEHDTIGTFTIICKTNKRANEYRDRINREFGQWVYASVHSEWKNPHLLIGYRSKELSKCEFCGWYDGMHSQYCQRNRE